MKKIILSMGIAFSGMAMAQYDGRVGITTTEPMATLDIQANGASKLNGILIPRVTKADAEAMGKNTGNIATNKLQESTMVYITEKDLATTANGQYTSKVDAKGFYYFDGTEWVKVGGGASSSTSTSTVLGPATGRIRTVSGMTEGMWTATDFAISIPLGALATFQFPAPGGANSGRIVAVRNNQGGTVTFTANAPLNNGSISNNRGMLVMSDGTRWYVIGGF